MIRQFMCLIFLAIVLLLRAAAPAYAADPNRSAPTGNSAPELGWGIDGAYLDDPTTFSLAQATGAQWVRASVYWNAVEPADTVPASYNWGMSDGDLNPIINAGLTPVVLIAKTPAWAGPYECGPIDTTDSGIMADFAEFMQAVAARYPAVAVWGLYHEVDSAVVVPGFSDGCFGNDVTGDLNANGVQDTADYAEMLATARKAVRLANPNAEVGISVAFDNFDTATCPSGYPGNCPANSTMNYNFLPDLFAYMTAHPRPSGEEYADIIGYSYFDIYGGYWESQTDASYHGIQAKAQFLRQLMQDAGVNFKLYVGQTGEDSGIASVGLDGQSQCLVTEMVRGAAAGLQGTSWWLIVDVPDYNWDYGLLDAALNPKPAYTAYQVLAQQLAGSVFETSLSKKQVEGYQFAQGNKKTAVLWSTAIADQSFVPCASTHSPKSFTFKNVNKLTTVDLYHATTTKIIDNQTGDLDPRVDFIKIKIGSAPMYVKYKQ